MVGERVDQVVYFSSVFVSDQQVLASVYPFEVPATA